MTFGLFDRAVNTFFKALGLTTERATTGPNRTREARKVRKRQRQARKRARRAC